MEYNRLWGNKCYLSGAMDLAPDGGIGWRQRVIPELLAMGIVPLDPCNKIIYGDDSSYIEDVDRRGIRDSLKVAGEWEEVREEMRPVRLIDLRMVNVSDFVIVQLDKNVGACGTHDEMTISNISKKPVLIHFEQGKEEAYDWLFSMLPHEHIFSTWDALLAYIDYINTTSVVVETYNRWIFLDYKRLYAGISHDDKTRTSFP